MGKQQKHRKPRVVKESPINVVLAAAACLALGLGIGYYFGRQSTFSTLEQATQTQTVLPNPSTFIQDEAVLKSILRSNPNNPGTLINLGNLYYDNGRFQEAVEWYGKALEFDPQNINVRTDRGTSYWNLNQPEAAIAEFQKSLSIDPSHPQTLFNLGVVYFHGKNDPLEARSAWERLLAAHPNYPDRPKVESLIASLPILGSSDAQVSQDDDVEDVSKGIKELFQRMKTRP
jgi:tetratricopeptide (TPR) repeat protein